MPKLKEGLDEKMKNMSENTSNVTSVNVTNVDNNNEDFNQTIFYVTYNFKNSKFLFFSPFLPVPYKRYNLDSPLVISKECFLDDKLKKIFLKKKNKKNLSKDYEDSISFVFEQNLDFVNNVSNRVETENTEHILNSYLSKKRKVTKKFEIKNNSDFLTFLTFCIFFNRLKKDSFLEIFQDAKVFKVRVGKRLNNALDECKKVQENIHFKVDEESLISYVNKFSEITEKYGICPLHMSNENIINCLNLFYYYNNPSLYFIFDILNVSTYDKFFKNHESYKNSDNLDNVFGMIFQRFIDIIILLKCSVRNQIFSYDRAISFIFDGKDANQVQDNFKICKEIISNEKKNLKKLIVHSCANINYNFNYHMIFFTIFLKDKKNNNLENMFKILGIHQKNERIYNDYLTDYYNLKNFQKISAAYDLDFIKEMVSFLN